MRSKLIVLSILVSFNLNVLSQNASQSSNASPSSFVTEYNRSALTMILLNHPEGRYSNKLQTVFKSIDVPSKFDDNTLAIQVISSNEINRDIINTFYDKKIGNSIIAKWYNRQPDGSFNMDLISNRGLYNATDQDVLISSAKKIGHAALKDSGEKLLSKSYILVLDYTNIQTSEEYYIANKVPVEKRTDHGWVGNFSAKLYKLNLNDSLLSIFYNDLWVNKEDASNVKAERASKFDQMDFPISFVTIASGYLSCQQAKPGTELAMFTIQKSDDQLFYELVEKGIEKTEYDIAAKYEVFKVKNSVYSTHPISSKMGLKEGLKVDYRFFVYENEQDKKGNIKEVRKGVVRAKNKIIDNRSVATGNSNAVSHFYQIGGKKIAEGMTLKQRNDKGIGVFVNYGSGTVGGVGVGVEYMVSGLLSKYIGFSPTSLKLFGEIGSDSDEDGYGYLRYDIGVSKSFYFARNFQIEPLVAYGSDGTTYEGEEVNASFVKYGIKIGANISYNLQFMIGYNSYAFLSEYENSTATSGMYSDFREGTAFELGLRLQF